MDITKAKDKLQTYIGKNGIHRCDLKRQRGTERLAVVHAPFEQSPVGA